MKKEINCRKVTEKINAHLDGELSSRESEIITAHIRGCSECREEYNALINLNKKLAVLDNIEYPDSLVTKLKTISGIDSHRITNLRLTNRLRSLSVAASILLAVFSGIFFGDRLVKEISKDSSTDYEFAQESLYSLWQEVIDER